MQNEIVECVLAVARAEIGVREEGVNRGKRVTEYLRAANKAPGNPWCAAFVAWCLTQAEARLGQSIPLPRTAYCPTLAAWARKKGVLHDRPRIGDVFLRWGKAGRAHRFKHAGFVSSVTPDAFVTIEGNTRDAGDRGPDGVVALRRPILDEYRFVRWIDAVG